jgi:hypothetical protein
MRVTDGEPKVLRASSRSELLLGENWKTVGGYFDYAVGWQGVNRLPTLVASSFLAEEEASDVLVKQLA